MFGGSLKRFRSKHNYPSHCNHELVFQENSESCANPFKGCRIYFAVEGSDIYETRIVFILRNKELEIVI